MVKNEKVEQLKFLANEELKIERSELELTKIMVNLCSDLEKAIKDNDSSKAKAILGQIDQIVLQIASKNIDTERFERIIESLEWSLK